MYKICTCIGYIKIKSIIPPTYYLKLTMRLSYEVTTLKYNKLKHHTK